MAKSELATNLAEVALFSKCTPRELKTVARHVETVTLDAGAVLTEQGSDGDAWFGIIAGTAEVRVDDEPVATLGPRDQFGELSLLDGEPRSATVVALEPLTVAVLGVRMFRTLMREFPEISSQLLAGLATELRTARAG
jgi:CRP/FNR family cyclic AMP-dependent transcriptional regulator